MESSALVGLVTCTALALELHSQNWRNAYMQTFLGCSRLCGWGRSILFDPEACWFDYYSKDPTCSPYQGVLRAWCPDLECECSIMWWCGLVGYTLRNNLKYMEREKPRGWTGTPDAASSTRGGANTHEHSTLSSRRFKPSFELKQKRGDHRTCPEIYSLLKQIPNYQAERHTSKLNLSILQLISIMFADSIYSILLGINLIKLLILNSIFKNIKHLHISFNKLQHNQIFYLFIISSTYLLYFINI